MKIRVSEEACIELVARAPRLLYVTWTKLKSWELRILIYDYDCNNNWHNLREKLYKGDSMGVDI